MCDLVKQFNCDVLDHYVDKGNYINGSLLTLIESLKTIKTFKSTLQKLFYNLVWSIGILNSEHNRYADMFINSNGVNIVLKLVNDYSIYNDFDEEFEAVVTYTLTSSCYENDRGYMEIKPIIPYL